MVADGLSRSARAGERLRKPPRHKGTKKGERLKGKGQGERLIRGFPFPFAPHPFVPLCLGG